MIWELISASKESLLQETIFPQKQLSLKEWKFTYGREIHPYKKILSPGLKSLPLGPNSKFFVLWKEVLTYKI